MHEKLKLCCRNTIPFADSRVDSSNPDLDLIYEGTYIRSTDYRTQNLSVFVL